VRFLSELGKVGPYSVSKARLIRRWQALDPTPAARDLLVRTSHAAVAVNDPVLTWLPAYSMVSGELPLDAFPVMRLQRYPSKEEMQLAFVRCQLDVTTAGPARLRLNSTPGLKAWLDGAPVEVSTEMRLDLGAGVRTLTWAIDLDQRREPLRVELDDVPGSPARMAVVNGK
jgi:hypothetical protein